VALISRLAGYFTGHVTKLDGPYSFSVPVSIGLNFLGLLFLLFAAITFNFPSTYPVTHTSMNYTSAAIGVIGLISIVTWVTTGRKQFKGPAGVDFLKGESDPSNAVMAADVAVDEKN
jgi:hypothetical protein